MDIAFSEKLDTVLRRIQKNNERESFLTICKSGASMTDTYEIEEAKQILLRAGYINKFDFRDSGEPYNITDKGVAFLRDGGFTKISKQERLIENINDATLRNLKSKRAIKIAIAAMIISGLSLLVSLGKLFRWFVFFGIVYI